MNLSFLGQDIIRLLSDRNWLLFFASTFALSNILLGVLVFGKREQVILVPPNITKPLKVQGGDVSKEYLEEIGIYMSKLLLDLSPSSFPYNHETLLKYAAPEAYGPLKKRLLKDGHQYQKLQLSTHFNPSQVTAFPDSLKIEVKGTLTSYVAGKQIDSTQETLWLNFTHRGGGLLLKNVKGGYHHEP